jgi:hypothetical protein
MREESLSGAVVENMSPATRFHTFHDGDEVHPGPDGIIVAVSASSIERYMPRLYETKAEKVEFRRHGGCQTCLG